MISSTHSTHLSLITTLFLPFNFSKKRMADKKFRGVCDITENGYGGFTMDSVFYDERKGEKWVTSIFRKAGPVPTKEPEHWKPSGFDFKAAVGGSVSKNKSTKKEVPGRKIKEVHHSKKVGSRRTEKDKESHIKKQLDKAFESHYTDILIDVTNRFQEVTGKVKCAHLKDMKNEDQRVTEESLEKMMENLKEGHGEGCDCKDYIKGLTEYHDAMKHFPSDFLDKIDPVEDIANDTEGIGKKEQKNEALEGLKEELEEGNGVDFDYEEYIKGLESFYDSLDASTFDFPEIQGNKEVKFVNQDLKEAHEPEDDKNF